MYMLARAASTSSCLYADSKCANIHISCVFRDEASCTRSSLELSPMQAAPTQRRNPFVAVYMHLLPIMTMTALITPLTSCTIRSCGVGTRPAANCPANCRHEARTDPTCHATGCSLQAGWRASAPGSGGRPCPNQTNMCVPWSRTAAVSAQ